jgi:hypothetical protein
MRLGDSMPASGIDGAYLVVCRTNAKPPGDLHSGPRVPRAAAVLLL